MTTFFELSGILPTELEFIEEKVRGLMRATKTHEAGVLLKEIVDMASKDKVSARDAAIEGFVVGAMFVAEQRIRQEQLALRLLEAELSIPDDEECCDDEVEEPAMNEGYL
jgi:hypothetical protein